MHPAKNSKAPKSDSIEPLFSLLKYEEMRSNTQHFSKLPLGKERKPILNAKAYYCASFLPLLMLSRRSSAKGEKLIATATCVKSGRSTNYYTVCVADELGNKVAEVTVTGFCLADAASHEETVANSPFPSGKINNTYGTVARIASRAVHKLAMGD